MYGIRKTSHRRDTENTEAAQRIRFSLRPLCVLCVSAVNLLSFSHNHLKFALVVSLIALALFASSGARSSPLQNGKLTAEEQRGQEIYLRGTSASEQEIIARLENTGAELPASARACANCHGRDGAGKSEGGIITSNITWENLTKPYGVTHLDGRKHPPYTERLLKRAITMGFDPAGNRLHVAMPRYQLSQADLACLIAYIKTIGTGSSPGITDTTVRIGATLITGGPFAEMSNSVKGILAAYFDDINRQGGIFNRRIELRFAESTDSPDQRLKALGKQIEDDQVFALTSVFLAGADEAMASLVREKEIPVVGASTLYPQASPTQSSYIFYVQSGLSEQARALALFAGEKFPGQKPRAAIIYPDDKWLREVAAAIKKQCLDSGWEAVEEVEVTRGQFPVAPLVERLNEKATRVVFFVAESEAQESFIEQAARINWKPALFIPGPLASRRLLDAQSGEAAELYLSFPSLPSDQTLEGLNEYRRLAETYKLSSKHLASQVAALASAKLLVEGLKRAGRNLSRQKFIEALETLYQFKTGLTPSITYSSNRHIGALGAYIVSIDKDKKLVPVSKWIALD